MEREDSISLFLPRFVSSHFDVVELSDTDNEIHIGLDEKRVIPPKLNNRDIISYGSTDSTTIQDFSVRGKAVFLHIRRRK